MNSRRIGWSVLGVVLLTGWLTSSVAEDSSDQRVFELRTYTTHPDKLDALHQRFRDHTNRLFRKHGMEPIAYWTPTDEPASSNTLIYVLAHKSCAEADRSWKAFRDDPEWQEAYKKSHADGPIVSKVDSVYMNATDYSGIR